MVEVPTFVGGGGGGIPSLWIGFWGIISISIGLIGKGFFDEIGKELAQTLFKKIKSLGKPSTIYIAGSGYELSVLVPAGITEDDCVMLSTLVNSFIEQLHPQADEHSKIYLTFDAENQKLVLINKTQ